MMTEENTKDIEYIKNGLLDEISKMKGRAATLKGLPREVMISVIYLKIFSAYLSEKKFESIEEAWKFMNDIKGIIDKIFYVNHYLDRVGEYLKKP